MERSIQLTPDTVLKEYWRDPRRFADLFNQVLFGGKELLCPEDLSDLDTDLSVNIQEKHGFLTSLRRRRDIVKKTIGDVDFAVLGIENQHSIHFAMPLRCYTYDVLNYIRQCKEISSKHNLSGDLKSTDEFLSGMKAEDRLNPVFTIVIYYGEVPWNGAKKLSDMMRLKEAYKPFFNDYTMRLLEVKDTECYGFTNADVSIFFNLLRDLYGEKNRENKSKILIEKYSAVLLNKEIMMAVSAAGGDKRLMKRIFLEKGEMSMCTFFEELIEEGIEKGEQRVNLLIQSLLEQSRLNEIKIAVNDREYQKKLFQEFGI